MNIYFLRHGIAVELGSANFSKDSERPLTPKGERKVGQVAEAMEQLGLVFDVILSSPYARARQTAEIVAEILHARKKLEFNEELTPGGSTRKLIELLDELRAKEVLLVGHEPYLSGLISQLVSGHETLSLAMKKGGLCKVSTDSLKHGRCAALEWLLTPKQMALMC